MRERKFRAHAFALGVCCCMFFLGGGEEALLSLFLEGGQSVSSICFGRCYSQFTGPRGAGTTGARRGEVGARGPGQGHPEEAAGWEVSGEREKKNKNKGEGTWWSGPGQEARVGMAQNYENLADFGWVDTSSEVAPWAAGSRVLRVAFRGRCRWAPLSSSSCWASRRARRARRRAGRLLRRR